MTGPSRGREAAAARRQGGTVATQPQGDAAGTMRQLLQQMKPELALALPRHLDPDRMARQALTAFRTTAKLDECTPASFLGALMTCAQVGLEPGPQGHVYIIPFWNNRARAMEATFILGYRGIIELARRSDQLVDISAHTIYSHEVEQNRFVVEYGSSPRILHKPIIFEDRGDPVGYYATATLKSGGTPFVVLSRADVDKFRLRSATQKENPSGPWLTDYEAMAWKTCVRRLERWLPQSAELAAAVAHEDTVRNVIPSQKVENVLDQQPPALETPDEAEDDMGADHTTGELPPTLEPAGGANPQPAGSTPPPPQDDPWAHVTEPGEDDDPWRTT